jgi:Zn-dependent metalloprotease
MKADVAKRLGIPEGAEDMFEVYTDEHGRQQIRLKDGMKTIQIGDTEYELVLDENGNQVLRMITKQKVGKETLEDIMRLAGNNKSDWV